MAIFQIIIFYASQIILTEQTNYTKFPEHLFAMTHY